MKASSSWFEGVPGDLVFSSLRTMFLNAVLASIFRRQSDISHNLYWGSLQEQAEVQKTLPGVFAPKRAQLFGIAPVADLMVRLLEAS